MDEKTHKKEVLWIIRDKYNGKIDKNLIIDIARLKNGEPVDYIIGWKSFLGSKIDLSLKPLIPREETEFWAEKAVDVIKQYKTPPKVLDVFSGSGCIGVSVLKNAKKARVSFAEIDKTLVKQIKINLALNNIRKERYKVAQSNIFSGIKGKYDFILANPPYIPTSHMAKVQKGVLKNEPHRALFGGKNGLNYITKFLKQAKKHLLKGGTIWLEFDPSQKISIEETIKENGYASWLFNKDQFNRWRFVIIS